MNKLGLQKICCGLYGTQYGTLLDTIVKAIQDKINESIHFLFIGLAQKKETSRQSINVTFRGVLSRKFLDIGRYWIQLYT